MLHQLAGWLATRCRGTAFQVDPDARLTALLSALCTRSMAVLRGTWHRLWLGRSAGSLFVGKGVVLRHRRDLRAGRGVVIEDYASIDALSRDGVTLGDGVTVQSYASIRVTGTIRQLGKKLVIGDRSSVGAYSFVGAAGGVTIGKDVLMGQRVGIHAENHVWTDPSIPIKQQGVTHKGIVIEDDCWIGSGSTILDGVTIGRGSVVAAGAVVTRSVPPYSIVAGVPARPTGSRGAPSAPDEPER